MRAFHRWISALAALFLLYVSVTGFALQAEMMLHGGGGAPGTASSVGPAPGRDLHLLLLKLHRGDIVGGTGTMLSLLCGAALAVLCVTGLVVYGEMLVKRWRLGRRRLFW